MSPMIHATLGNLRPTISTVEPFNPLRWLTCPGNLDRLRRVAMSRYRRDVAEGRVYRGKAAAPVAPRSARSARVIRQAAADRAMDAVLCRFVDADYRKLRITDDEPARAALFAIAAVRKAGWREPTPESSRRENRKGEPFSGSAASRGDDPSRIAAAVETAHARYGSAIRREIDREAARAALIGSDREEVCREPGDAAGIGARTDVVVVEGGECYVERRKMVPTAERFTFVDCGEQYETNEKGERVKLPRFRKRWFPGGWKMAAQPNRRKAAFAPCVVPLVADLG